MRKRKDGDTKDEKKFTEGEMEQEENKKKNKEKKSGAAEDRTGGSVEDGESGKKKGAETRWVMKARWRRQLCNITGPQSYSPPPILSC